MRLILIVVFSSVFIIGCENKDTTETYKDGGLVK